MPDLTTWDKLVILGSHVDLIPKCTHTMKKIVLYTLLVIALIIGTLGINLLVFNKTATRISKGDPIPDYETDNPALLVVDIQEATTGSVSWTDSYISQGEALISRINQLTVLTDSARIPVVFIVNVVRNPLVNILNNSMSEGSEGARPDGRLILVSDHVVSKTKNDAFFNTDLDRILAEMKVNHLYIAGLDAAYCINCTLQGALGRGYRVSLIDDAVISAPEEKKEVMFGQFRDMGVEIISSSDYPEAISSR